MCRTHAAIELAESSYAAALNDYLRKKKSKLQHSSLLECVSKAPGLAAAAQPLAVVAKEAGGPARNAFIQVRTGLNAVRVLCKIDTYRADFGPPRTPK